MFSSNHNPCSTNVFSLDSFFEHENNNLQFNPFTIQQEFSDGSGLQDQDQDDLLDSIVSPIKKKITTSMKDELNKIYTTRGPRDRRVRLSIDIARKFFCLQDLLGFSKPSKTLDWLLTKSLPAIKKLVEETVVTDQSRVKFLETILGDSHGPRKKMAQRCCKDNFSRYQSRIEARSRARERAKEKLRVKRCFDQDSRRLEDV